MDYIVWRVSLEPMDEHARHPHLIRLFPHGAIILLTNSLILYHPHDVLRIIMWFRLAILAGTNRKTPGTWKLAVRYRVRSWLLDILDLYEDTREDVFGCGKQVFADIYANITWLLECEYLLKSGNYALSDRMASLNDDDETPHEDSPLVGPASLHIMRDRKEWSVTNGKPTINHTNINLNDDILATWFAEWAVLACESFRRFHIVLGVGSEAGNTDECNGVATEYGKKWGHVEVFAPEAFHRRHGVPSQAELDALETERLRRNREKRDRK